VNAALITQLLAHLEALRAERERERKRKHEREWKKENIQQTQNNLNRTETHSLFAFVLGSTRLFRECIHTERERESESLKL
jgi:hypothetical protein